MPPLFLGEGRPGDYGMGSQICEKGEESTSVFVAERLHKKRMMIASFRDHGASRYLRVIVKSGRTKHQAQRSAVSFPGA